MPENNNFFSIFQILKFDKILIICFELKCSKYLMREH